MLLLKIFLGVMVVLCWSVAISMMVRGSRLMDQIIRQVNAKVEPKDRVPVFLNSWRAADVRGQHQRLYPQSPIHREFTRTTILFFVSAAIGTGCLILLSSLEQPSARGRDLFRVACERDPEGIVVNWAHGTYQTGDATPWLKIRNRA